MEFLLSRLQAPKLVYVEQTGSTNSDLVSSATRHPSDFEHFSVLVTDNQTAGRGRSGREWVAPPGVSLAVSVLLRPSFSPTQFGWLPLLAGLAMSRTVSNLLPGRTDIGLKWPNDVLVGNQKISGVLSELLPDLSGVVIGAGLNVSQTHEQLPVEMATSLRLQADQETEINLDAVLAAYLDELRELSDAFEQAGGDAAASGLRELVSQNCLTIGCNVRAIMPGDTEVTGKAITIDESGRLVIATDGTGQLTAIAAGDIVHLRLAS
jgi:BirA family biotin operon repressor/biotin-[acetyl-CoA-carboxylase] ligase